MEVSERLIASGASLDVLDEDGLGALKEGRRVSMGASGGESGKGGVGFWGERCGERWFVS